jgi:hypothetical protein
MPLVRLRRIGADVASLIYAKVESLNPGGSVKDRVGVGRVIRCRFIFSGKNDELTPDFPIDSCLTWRCST